MRSTVLLTLAIASAACGSSFSSGGSDDAGDEHVSADAPSPVDAGGDVAAADVQHAPDAEQLDAGDEHASADAGVDAPPCTPVTFPLAMPGCAPITGPGSTWLLQPQATPPACFSYALNEAGTACERCASTFTCACIDPDGGLIGVTCETSASGVPVLVQQ